MKLEERYCCIVNGYGQLDDHWYYIQEYLSDDEYVDDSEKS